MYKLKVSVVQGLLKVHKGNWLAASEKLKK